MHQAVQQPSIQRSWWSRLFAHPEPLVERRWVSFPDLVRVHLERTRVLDSTADVGERRAADAAYDEARRDFERAEGQIVNVYWCSDLPSAAALTVQPRWRMLRRLGWPQRLYFHRASDWSTHDEPRLASLLHECDELAVKSSEVLRGTPHRICMGLAMRGAGNGPSRSKRALVASCQLNCPGHPCRAAVGTIDR